MPPPDSLSPLRAFLAENDVPCPACGYNLRGARVETCPECGRALEVTVTTPGLPAVPPRLALLAAVGVAGWILLGASLMLNWLVLFAGNPPTKGLTAFHWQLGVSIVVHGALLALALAGLAMYARRRWRGDVRAARAGILRTAVWIFTAQSGPTLGWVALATIFRWQ